MWVGVLFTPMRQTETEVVEKEVERVYCDECGSDCTEDHEYAAQEVCPSCSDGGTFDSAKDALKDVGAFESETEPDLAGSMLFIIMFPLTFTVIFLSYFDNEPEPTAGDWATFMTFSIGSILWTVVFMLLLL